MVSLRTVFIVRQQVLCLLGLVSWWHCGLTVDWIKNRHSGEKEGCLMTSALEMEGYHTQTIRAPNRTTVKKLPEQRPIGSRGQTREPQRATSTAPSWKTGLKLMDVWSRRNRTTPAEEFSQIHEIQPNLERFQYCLHTKLQSSNKSKRSINVLKLWSAYQEFQKDEIQVILVKSKTQGLIFSACCWSDVG